MLGKIVNSGLALAPKKININGFLTFNPTNEMLKEQGYKEIMYSETPEPVEGKSWIPIYKDDTDVIVQTWDLIETPYQPETELEQYKAFYQSVMEEIR